VAAVQGRPGDVDVPALLSGYQAKRLGRAAAIHGMAGMAAFMASTYKAWLGEGLGPLSWITRFRVPHPGRVSPPRACQPARCSTAPLRRHCIAGGGPLAPSRSPARPPCLTLAPQVAGQAILKLTMPSVLQWVLGGNIGQVARTRAPHCKLGDQPKGFSESDFGLLMRDDEQLAATAQADWLLLAERPPSSGDATSTSEAKGAPRRAAPGCAAACAAGLCSCWRAPLLAPPRPCLQGRGRCRMPGCARLTRLHPPSPPPRRRLHRRAAGAGGQRRVAGRRAHRARHARRRAARQGARRQGLGLGRLCWRAPRTFCPLRLSLLPARLPTTTSPTTHHAAQVWKQGGGYFLRDLGSASGTYVNGHRVAAHADVKLRPLDVVEFARQPAPEAFKVKLQHVSLRTDELHGYEYTSMLVGRRQEQVNAERDAAAAQRQAALQQQQRGQPVMSS
jgi:hypothetical protein